MRESPSIVVEDLRRRLEQAVGRLCPRWLREDRDDLVQTSVVRILERVRDGGPADFNATYLWKTAYTVVLDEVRRVRHKYERALDENEDAPSTPPLHDPERRTLAREFVDMVRDCLSGLSADRRRAVQLRLAGLSHAEVAELLASDEKRTANLLFRGFGELRACLRAKGVDR